MMGAAKKSYSDPDPLRVPPHSVEAEQAVLGGLMLDNAAWERVADRLREEDFYRQDHRLIFRAITELTDSSTPFDVVTLAEWLQSRNQLEQAGGLAYLATLARDIPTAANVRAYADIVRERSALRQLIRMGGELADAAFFTEGRAAREIATEFLRKLPTVSENKSLRALALDEFLKIELAPRSVLLDPWLPTQGLCMVYGSRGIGKTHLSLGIGFAVASAGTFLRWHASSPSGVLFADGEMPAPTLQERLAALVRDSDVVPVAPLDIVTPDLQPNGIPDLATNRGQAAFDALVKPEHKLVVIDNLSAMVRSGVENESESWLPVQSWALRHRAAGRSVLFIHHSGKSGQQRGTSRREDILDTVIALRHSADYQPQDGAKFEVHFEKARMLHGEVVTPFEARLDTDPTGKAVWTTRDLEDSTFERVVGLAKDGLRGTEIAAELGLNRSTVSRHLKQARQDGIKLPQPTECRVLHLAPPRACNTQQNDPELQQ
jgi:hypothetical protein